MVEFFHVSIDDFGRAGENALLCGNFVLEGLDVNSAELSQVILNFSKLSLFISYNTIDS